MAPFFILPGNIAEPGLYQALYFLVISAIFVSFGAELNKRITALAVVAGIFILINPDPFELFSIYKAPMILGGVAFLACVKRSYKEAIFKALAAICILECFWTMGEWLGFYPYEQFLGMFGLVKTNDLVVRPIIGSLGNPNHSGALIASTIFFAPTIFWPLAIVSLVLLGSTMPFVSLVSGCIALYTYKTKNWIALKLGGIGLGIAALSVAFLEAPRGVLSSTGRVAAWTNFTEHIGVTWFGEGLSFVATKWGKNYQSTYGRFYKLHNEWLEIYSIAGLVGVAFILWFILPVFKDKGAPAVNALLIALLVNSLGNFTFHIAPLFMVFGACFALQIKEI